MLLFAVTLLSIEQTYLFTENSVDGHLKNEKFWSFVVFISSANLSCKRMTVFRNICSQVLVVIELSLSQMFSSIWIQGYLPQNAMFLRLNSDIIKNHGAFW
ncbi:unnamed protein product [Clavelina lepadiformis]|uniref:Uncharacterized protein n=1 Tax=Clavelina lepadiformis TaxID=159417 RepID=A0ABP0GC13_CLALP